MEMIQRGFNFNPVPRVRNDDELRSELREKLKNLTRSIKFNTHAELIAAVEEVLREAKFQENLHQVQRTIPPPDPDDD